MKVKANETWEKIKAFFLAMSRTAKIIAAVVLVVFLILIVALISATNKKEYTMLFTDLTETSMNSVVKYLSDSGVVDYQISGNSILVLADQEVQLRADLVLAGYPDSGFGYESYYEYLNGMSTDTDKETSYIQYLQTRMQAVIRQFDGVKDAWVTIGEGQDYRYILDSQNSTPTTAGVLVSMQDGQTMSKTTAAAIRTLVQSSVKGLTIDNVKITDTTGNIYSDLASGSDAVSEASAVKLQMEETVNNQVRSEVLQAIAPFYAGSDHVKVSVRSTVDVDRKIISSTDYPYPEDWLGEDGGEDGRGIIGHEMWSNYVYSEDAGTVGGVVGAGVNSDITIYPGDANGDGEPDTWGSTSGDVTYQNPEEVTQREVLAGTVTDISVSVSINSRVVDYEADIVISEEQLVQHVARAAGINTLDVDEKISVLIGPFPTVEPEDLDAGGILIQTWMIFAGLGGLALFIIVLIIIILISRKKKREREEQEALEAEMARQEEERLAALEAAEAAAANPTDGADIMDLNTEKSMELRKDLRTFVGNNPEIAATLLRNLMKGGETESA